MFVRLLQLDTRRSYPFPGPSAQAHDWNKNAGMKKAAGFPTAFPNWKP
jgi:hypothetical protein